jgi:hypothetical protein
MKAAGAFLALDLGAASYLRYLPTARIISDLRQFNLVFLSRPVTDTLLTRTGAPSIAGLASHLPQTTIVSTRGPDGVLVSDGNGPETVVRALSEVKVIDDAGAGDALAAFTIDYLARTHSGRGVVFTQPQVAEAAALATIDLAPVLATLGARGHLGAAPASKLDTLRGASSDAMRDLLGLDRPCPMCFLSVGAATLDAAIEPRQHRRASGHSRGVAQRSVAAPRKLTSGDNLKYMLDRILWAGEASTAVAQVRRLLDQSGTAYVVGSGGSYPAARLIADVLTRHGWFAQAVRPGEYLSASVRTDAVIAVSYSGRTPDLASALKMAGRHGVSKRVVLTAVPHPALAGSINESEGHDEVVAYGPSGRVPGRAYGARERGFVSIAGTVMPCVPWMVAEHGFDAVIELVRRLEAHSERIQHLAKRLADEARMVRHLNVIAAGRAQPAAIDVESKFTESGLPAVTVHEAKDFSHGRFMSVLRPPSYEIDEEEALSPVLLLTTGPLSRYQQHVARIVGSRTTLHTLSAASDDTVGAIELLAAVQWLSQAVGRVLDVDISRPREVPDGGLRLYGWRGELP